MRPFGREAKRRGKESIVESKARALLLVVLFFWFHAVSSEPKEPRLLVINSDAADCMDSDVAGIHASEVSAWTETDGRGRAFLGVSRVFGFPV